MSHVDDEKTEAASFWSCLDDIQEGLEVSQSKIVHGTIFILQRFLSIHQAFFYGCRMFSGVHHTIEGVPSVLPTSQLNFNKQ